MGRRPFGEGQAKDPEDAEGVTIREEMEGVLRTALELEYPALGHLKFEVFKSHGKAFGDFASNVAILAGKALGGDPMALAETLGRRARTSSRTIAAIETARPGFINISVTSEAYLAKLGEIVAWSDDETYGSCSLGEGKLVQVEFVSANPTGPLNVVSARAAAVGDSLVRLLRRIGFDARSEFYVNDAGTQIEMLGNSLEARLREILGESVEIPEGGYPGEYLKAVAQKVKGLADWADRQLEADRDQAELPPAEEAGIIEDFLAREALPGQAGSGEIRDCLAEYRSFKQALPPDQGDCWAALYICDLSGRSIGTDDLTARLVWLDRYRSFLRATRRGEGTGHSRVSTPAARVFTGEAAPGRRFDFSRFAIERIVEGQRASLQRFGRRPEGGLTFDAWVRESSLKDLLSEVSARLVSDRRFVYEKDGAVWLKDEESQGQDRDAGGGEESDERDEWVIRRRTGKPTYFLTDITYHIDKRRRGFDRVIDIWGPDHHGHVGRMKTAMAIVSRVMPELAIGDDWLEVLIAQQVNLVREGKRVQMSKRAGEYVTLDDVVTEVGADAARFFFLMRRSNSHLDFDLDLAKRTSEENPVYYIQYAHARICSILEFAGQNGFDRLPPPGAGLSLLVSPEEMDLVKGLGDFEDVVRASALAHEPHRIVGYLVDLAGRFHRFYHNHRVVTEDRPLSEARLCLCWAMRTILRSALSLIGVSAPASM